MVNRSSIEIEKNNSITTIKDKEKIEVKSSPTLMSQYHEGEIKQNKMIVKNAIGMIWVGLLLIIASFVVYVIGLTENLVSGTVCGIIIDLFSGTILYLFNKSSKNKKNYFNNLSNMENEKTIIELIKDSKNDNFREEMIRQIVNKRWKI